MLPFLILPCVLVRCRQHANKFLTKSHFNRVGLKQKRTASTSSSTTTSTSSGSNQKIPKILITGGLGQIGSELLERLVARFGRESVIIGDIRKSPPGFLPTTKNKNNNDTTPFVYANVVNSTDIERIIVEYGIDWIIHNASLLSATGERQPQYALKVNLVGLQNILELARQNNIRVLAPSSIAAFGPTTPKILTPDITIMRPNTIYGITKLHLELLGEYYTQKCGLDFRSLRYPGIISSKTEPGGGTTDYAVEIFYQALKTGRYECFLNGQTNLPMMYMPDCLDATIALLTEPAENLKQRTYNVTSVSFTPEQLAAEIKKRIPHFEITYKPDFRQAIADSWPASLDDSNARNDWGWSPKYDLSAIVDDMLFKLSAKLKLPYHPHQ